MYDKTIDDLRITYYGDLISIGSIIDGDLIVLTEDELPELIKALQEVQSSL